MLKKKEPRPPLPSTPWRRRHSDDGIYFGHNGSVWVYFELPLAPIKWEDAQERLEQGGVLDGILTTLGDSSTDVANGLASLAVLREVHIFCATFDRNNTPPQTPTEAHRKFLASVLPSVGPGKSLLVGVKLWNQAKVAVARGGAGGSAASSLWRQTKTVLARDVDSEDAFGPYKADFEIVTDMMRRGGGKRPSPEALRYLESWFNDGRGPDVPVYAAVDEIQVAHADTWELAAVCEFERPSMSAPSSAWLMDAMSHSSPAEVVSIRADLLPATILRAQLRQAQRKLRAAEEEEAKTGDISRDEIGDRSSLAKDLENRVQAEGKAWLAKTSILLARKKNPWSEDNSSYIDMLRNTYQIQARPLEHRQLEALNEMQPCSRQRSNPFDQVLSIPMVAYAGLPSFSNIGDPGNLWLGSVDPDQACAYVEAAGAPRNNKPPVMAIFGDPGSGKAQPLTARVLTPGGWTTMGQLRVGDAVIGRDGGTHRVIGVYPQGVKAVYRVRFDDGSQTEATADHLWAVLPARTRHRGESDRVGAAAAVRTTAELAEDLLDAQGGHRWQIPLTGAVEHCEAVLPQDPYLFGAQLTDDGLLDTARQPVASSAYLSGSVAQRVAALQGLLDSRGQVEGGFATLTTASHALAGWARELVQSLGGICHTDLKVAHEPAATADEATHLLRIAVPAEIGVPFRDPDKCRAWAACTPAVPSRSIVEITYLREDLAQCIAVSAPDRLYLTDEHIVTHNTFAAQLLAGQAALSGTQTILINPKGFDSLRSFADWVAEYGVPSQVVSMRAMEGEAGAFDPFRFAEPRMAAEILTRHILTVLGVEHAGGLDGRQEVELGAGLVRGAEAGARCAADALNYVNDTQIRELVLSQAAASSLFRLGFGYKPAAPFSSEGRGLTLVEFDREMPLPEPGVQPGREERIALAAMRLVTRASMEILMRAKGGVLVVDEAHHYLNSTEGMASLQRMGREGRSLGLLPIFLTQRVSDLLHADMENYLSRVLVMKLTDPREADAALQLCGLRPTKQRIDFLREAGPRKPVDGQPGRPSLGFFRDIDGRHAVVSIGPIPEDIRLAFSTNPDDREKREELLARAAGRPPTPGKTASSTAEPHPQPEDPSP